MRKQDDELAAFEQQIENRQQNKKLEEMKQALIETKRIAYACQNRPADSV